MAIKISKAMKIWLAGMGIVIVVTLSLTSLILGLTRVTYGRTIHMDENIRSIRYRNPSMAQSVELSRNVNNVARTEAMTEILDLLRRGGRTNRFAQIFWQSSGRENTTSLMEGVSTINAIYQRSRFIEISFMRPQFSIAGTNEATFELVHDPDGNYNLRVHAIYILLDEVENRFTRQDWRFRTGGGTILSHRLRTFGNYYRLANFIDELTIT